MTLNKCLVSRLKVLYTQSSNRFRPHERCSRSLLHAQKLGLSALENSMCTTSSAVHSQISALPCSSSSVSLWRPCPVVNYDIHVAWKCFAKLSFWISFRSPVRSHQKCELHFDFVCTSDPHPNCQVCKDCKVTLGSIYKKKKSLVNGNCPTKAPGTFPCSGALIEMNVTSLILSPPFIACGAIP